MAITLMLERTTLHNVDDVAGRWQYEGGTVFQDKRQIGYYASTKRVIFGATDAQNTAMLTLEVFATPQMPPQNFLPYRAGLLFDAMNPVPGCIAKGRLTD